MSDDPVINQYMQKIDEVKEFLQEMRMLSISYFTPRDLVMEEKHVEAADVFLRDLKRAKEEFLAKLTNDDDEETKRAKEEFFAKLRSLDEDDDD